jgi:hypothetical protein
MKLRIIVVLETIVIISKAKRVGTQKVARLVQHVHHPIGNAKYVDLKYYFLIIDHRKNIHF